MPTDATFGIVVIAITLFSLIVVPAAMRAVQHYENWQVQKRQRKSRREMSILLSKEPFK